MKILLLMDNPTIPTGYASTCRLTARELMKRGYQVWATAFNGGRAIREAEEWNGIRVVPNYALDRDPHAIYGDAECVRRICDEIKPDILFWHNDSYRYSYMSQLPKEILDRSVFWLPFEGENADMLGVGLFSRCAATRFVTRYALDLHRQHLSGKDIGYIPHAIGVDRLTPIDQAQKREAKAAKQYGIEDKFVVVRVDRHQPRKYWDRSLRAFAKFAEGKDDVFFLAKCNPRDVTMYSVKDGRPTGLDLGALASDLGIAQKVKFDDFFFDDSFMARAFLHPADVFLTTTSGEGFGLCPAEAMACGIPVLAPDTPVLPEVLGGGDDRDAGGGIFSKLEGRTFYDAMQVWHNLVDVDDVAAKLEWAYRDWKAGGKELALIGARGRKIALDRYDPKVVYDQWHQVFTDIAVKDDLVSMVTVLYNLKGEDQISGEDGIGKFRETVEKYVTTPYEWIMVDNGSPQRDVTRKWMREAAHANPRIKPIFLDVNMGYAGGNNAGIAAAKGNWIVLANPDSEALDPKKQMQPGDFMKMLVDTAKADPKVGIVGMEINDRPDVMPGLSFPYFCCALITRKCLDAIRDKDGKWLDESFWPAYYEDACLCLRARQKGFKIAENKGTTFWHKSGGTNKHAIEGGREGPHVGNLKAAIGVLEKAHPDMADWPRKRGELAADGMQGLIRGNIRALNRKYGIEARKGIKVVWHVHVGDGVGFSQIAEGLAPKMEEAGFDVYVNDWSNGRNIEDPAVRRLWEKHKKANLGDGLDDAIHIVCWLMETFLNVDANFKIGISLCESTKVRSSYLHACNSMDRILTFSEFCRNVQVDSGYEVPIDIIAPGVNPIYLRYQDRPRRKDKFSFLSVGVAQGRKETHKLVELFCEAFPKGADRNHLPDCEPGFPYDGGQVELILKSNNFGELGWVEPYKQRANIRTIFTGQDQRSERPDFSTEEMRALYDEVDCLVHPSHAEGVGYPLIESAATGLPIIFTNWSSPAEYFDESNSYPCSLSPYPGTTFTKAYPGAPGDNGLWANAHCGHFKHLMRQVIRNPEEARQKGLRAAEHMAKNFNWDNTARQMVPMMFEWEERRRMKETKEQFNALTYQKPSLKPVMRGDRVLVDICTRDRHLPLSCLLVSLRAQTFKDWDVLVQCDDSDESMPNDFMIMSIMGRLQHEGHGWRIIRGHRQGPHIGHDRSLQMAADDPHYKYKLICRIDDDIMVDPAYLESLIDPFYGDSQTEIAAVGGVYLDPKRADAEQTAPADFRTSVEYAGIIDHNVPWPYVCRYPEGTGLREVEHLYSSFMYRVEVGVSIGGYCRKLSQIGHREESDFSYRFHLAGYRQYIQPKAVGYHFCVPAGGIRAGDIVDKGTLAAADHQIYVNRIAKWKRQLEQRRRLEAGQGKAPDAETGQKPDAGPRAPTVTKGKMAAVINGGRDFPRIQRAIDRLSGIANEIYVTCEDEGAKGSLFGDRLAMVACSPDESAMLARQLASAGDHEFVMTVPDTLVFQRDPRPMLDDAHDNYVFEVYRTYIPGRHRQDGGQSVFVQDDGIGTVIGPECRNMCLICRREASASPIDVGRTKYLDMLAWEDERLAPVDGKSIAGNDLLPVRDMERVNWRKVCTYQFPEGKLKEPFYMDVKASDAPLVSIIIPTIDRCKLLKKCIDSIYAFTTTPFELIIVDNNSSDGTFKLMEEQQFRGNLHGLRLNMNVGYQRAVNMGIDNAKGKYLLLFNDDAWVEKYWRDGRDWLRVMIDDLEADPAIGVIGPHEGTSPALGSHVLYFWCIMMRRSFYNEIGPLDDATFFNYGGDDDYCERTRKAGYKVQYKHGYDADGVLRHLMNLVPKEKQAPEIEESRRKLLEKYRK